MLIYRAQIQKLIQDFFASQGYGIEKIDDDYWKISSPKSPDQLLENRSELCLAFSPEYLEQDDNSILVTAGAPLIRNIREILAKMTRVGHAFIDFDPSLIISHIEKKSENIRFIGCSPLSDGTSIMYYPVCRYLFSLDISGEEAKQELIPVFLDLVMEKFLIPPPPFLLESPLLEKPPVEGDIWEKKSPGDFFYLANSKMSSIVSGVLARVESHSGEKLKAELERIKTYFEDLTRKAKNKEEKKLVEESAAKHRKEIKERYTLKGFLEIENALNIYLPMVEEKLKFEKGEKTFYLNLIYDVIRDEYAPVLCPLCGKETLKVSVCKEHGINCSEKGWICPVCSESRCEACEAFICSIDGLGKDPECTFNCRFCQSRAGKDHEVKCTICGASGCSGCVVAGESPDRFICPDCGGLCAVCGKTFTRKELKRCEMCPADVCSGCGLRECAICEKKVCHQHSFQCAGCGRTICKGCLGGEDQASGEMLCRECAVTCPYCKKSTSSGGLVELSDGEKCCSKCAVTCDSCGKTGYKDEMVHCSMCKADVCREHVKTCGSCGEVYCERHFAKCGNSELDFCGSCMEDGEKPIWKAFLALQPLKDRKLQKTLEKLGDEFVKQGKQFKWQYAETKKLGLLYGTGGFNDLLIIFEKKSGEKILNRRISPLEKLKKAVGLK